MGLSSIYKLYHFDLSQSLQDLCIAKKFFSLGERLLLFCRSKENEKSTAEKGALIFHVLYGEKIIGKKWLLRGYRQKNG